jgi:hypothetical protein
MQSAEIRQATFQGYNLAIDSHGNWKFGTVGKSSPLLTTSQQSVSLSYMYNLLLDVMGTASCRKLEQSPIIPLYEGDKVKLCISSLCISSLCISYCYYCCG